MTKAPLELTREQVLAHRRSVGALDARLPRGAASLRRAAWAGLTDSMPRAAVLSIHARVTGTEADTWEDPSLVQLWGPRFSAYVVAAQDVGVFTLGRLPLGGTGLARAETAARRLREFLAGRRMTYGEAGRGIGVGPNSLRYGAPTGTILMRWDGARQPVVWTVPPPAIEPGEARLELARRYLHVFGPGTATGYSPWAGVKPAFARSVFEALAGSLTSVRTPIGEAWILSADEAAFRAPATSAGSTTDARLLPSGDAYYLLQGADRELLVPEPDRRRLLWTSRVWPGAVLLGGEIAGTWRREDTTFTIEPWRRLTPREREAIEAEAASLPLAGLPEGLRVRWVD